MRKNKGFIATSLLFSFLTLMIVLILMILASYQVYRSTIGGMNQNIMDSLNDNLHDVRCTIVQGDGIHLGDLVNCSGEYFYVIENDYSYVTLLAKNTLYTQNDLTQIHQQSTENSMVGLTSYSDITTYQNAYVSYLTNKGFNGITSSLPTLDLVKREEFGCTAIGENCLTSYDWINNRNYWLGTSYDETTQYVINSKKLNTKNATYTDGIRVVITMPVSNVDILGAAKIIYNNIDEYSTNFEGAQSILLEGQTLTLGKPTRAGSNFLGWYTGSEMYSSQKVESITFTNTDDINLYAKWKENEYTLTYDANGGTNAPSSQKMTFSNETDITSETPTRDGYVFLGWSTTKEGSVFYQAGDIYKLYYKDTLNKVNEPMKDATLYAVWHMLTGTLTFDANGGSGEPSSITMQYGTTTTIPSTKPVKSGYTFLGWSTNPNDSEPSYAINDVYREAKDTEKLKDVTLYALWYMSNKNFDYTGGEQTFTVTRTGTYALEVWGAAGGNDDGQAYGFGGYSYGEIYLTKGTVLYIHIGGVGADCVASTGGGYNGGGNAGWHGCSGGGGGATHIATASGQLNSLSGNKLSILIVAGGGGGAGLYGGGGSGGGYKGNGSYGSNGGYYINRDTLTYGTGSYGGSFGIGGTNSYDGGGGGGGYAAGGASTSDYGGSGGSGYIGNTNLTNAYMYCYSCSTSNDTLTKTYSTGNVSSSPVSKYAKKGNGYAKIYMK